MADTAPRMTRSRAKAEAAGATTPEIKMSGMTKSATSLRKPGKNAVAAMATPTFRISKADEIVDACEKDQDSAAADELATAEDLPVALAPETTEDDHSMDVALATPTASAPQDSADAMMISPAPLCISEALAAASSPALADSNVVSGRSDISIPDAMLLSPLPSYGMASVDTSPLAATAIEMPSSPLPSHGMASFDASSLAATAIEMLSPLPSHGMASFDATPLAATAIEMLSPLTSHGMASFDASPQGTIAIEMLSPLPSHSMASSDTPPLAATAIEMLSPTVAEHPACVVEDAIVGGTPQQPLQEFSFDLMKGDVADDESVSPATVAEPPATQSIEQAPHALGTPVPSLQAGAGQALPKTPKSTAAPRSVVKTPQMSVRPASAAASKSPLPVPASASKKTPIPSPVPAALKTPLPAPASAASKTPLAAPASAASRTPLAAPASAGVRRTSQAKAVCETTPSAVPSERTVRARPPPAKLTEVSLAKPAEKRVSISSALPSTERSSFSRPVICTPYPKAGAKTTPVDCMPEYEPLAMELASDLEGPTASVALPPMVSIGAAAEPDYLDASMLLAACRTTVDEAPGAAAEEQEAPEASAAVQALAAPPPMEDMDVDMDDAPAPSPLPPRAPPSEVAAAMQRRESAARPVSALKTKTPSTAAKESPFRIRQVEPVDTVPAASSPDGPKLTFPVATASYMAGTQSSFQKLSPGVAVAASKPRVKSVVVGPRGDDKSIKQLKREIKAATEAKAQALANLKGMESDEEMEEAPYNEADEALLVAAMTTKIGLNTDKRAVLNGMPMPLGSHVRFDDSGTAVDSPTSRKTLLKGLPTPKGRHMRFDE